MRLSDLPTQSYEEAIDIALAEKGLRSFISAAWGIVEPAQAYMPAWHIDAICEHLEAVFKNEIEDLVITVPPGTSKSITTCVMFPAWAWTQDPAKKFGFAANADDLVRRDSMKCRNLVESDWYKRRWPGTKINYSLEASANNYSTTAGGTRKAFTVAGAVVGAHYDIQVVDDPIKPYEVTGSLAVSDRVLDRVWSWWTETMSTRKLPGKKRGRIVIMQRLCEGDLAGRCKDAGYEYLCLPMRYDSARKCVTKIFTDPREEEGELLCPDRFPEEEVRKTERDLGTRGAQAQLQLDPKARSGGTFDEKHAVFYDKLPYLIKQVQSWDCTFSETGDSYVVGQVWGQADPANFYLIDEIREKLSFTNTLKAVKRLSVLYPKSRSKYIEKKANGAAVIDALKKEVVGLIPVEPEGGKEARANAMSSLWEGGNIHLPADKPWIKDWVAEVTGFPGARDKDRVDAMTQAINKLYRSAQSSLKKAMENIR